ncbi:MAG: Ig domain-containing protein, partial [Bryobacteraceae bacterium]
MNRRTLALLWIFASFAGVAAAQPYSCNAFSGTQPIRAEGIAEYIADIVVVCGNGSTNSVSSSSLIVTLNANITSRVDQNGISEAILLLDETPSDRSEGFDIFRGVQTSANTVRFDGVFVYEPGSGVTRTYRFSNIRVDASQLPPGTPIQAQVTNTGQTTLPVGQVTAAIVQQPQQFAVRTCDDAQTTFVNFQQSVSQNDTLAAGKSTTGNIQFNVKFSGNFAGAYRKQFDQNQNPFAPGVHYNTESDSVDTISLGAFPGVATQGTRLMSRFNNIPAGVRLFVTTQPLGPGGASTTTLAANLISVDANGAGSSSPVSATATGMCPSSGATQFIAELPIVAGSAQAVWEVTNSSSTALEKASFGVVVAYISSPTTGLPATGTAMTNLRLGPVSTVTTASATTPAPRFASSNINTPAFAINGATGGPLTIVTPSPLPPGQVGASYSLPTFTASGGTPAYAWALVAGSTPPPGLTLASNGTFAGVPTAAGTFTFNVRVNDQQGVIVTKSFSTTISPTAALTITTASPLPGGQVGVAYS